LRLGQALGRRGAATAAIDLSDGLADGVARIAEASGVGMELHAASLPVHPDTLAAAAALGHDSVRAALAGGDDYELLFTVRPRMKGRLRQALRHGAVTATRIGACTAERTITLTRMRDGRAEVVPLDQSPEGHGFHHFR